MAEIYALGLDFMQYNNSLLLRALAEQGQPSLCCLTAAGCFSISQLPHGNAYLIGKEKRSGIDYFFAGGTAPASKAFPLSLSCCFFAITASVPCTTYIHM